MPRDLLGPTLEDVQMWLRSASGWVSAGFVLNVEPVNARLGRVLVVEDDPGIATQLVRGLTRAGYETGSVTTGKAALDWPVPDVFLLDLGLPDMDGVEVCRRLRQACDAAIIIVTARCEETDRVLSAAASSPPASPDSRVSSRRMRAGRWSRSPRPPGRNSPPPCPSSGVVGTDWSAPSS